MKVDTNRLVPVALEIQINLTNILRYITIVTQKVHRIRFYGNPIET